MRKLSQQIILSKLFKLNTLPKVIRNNSQLFIRQQKNGLNAISMISRNYFSTESQEQQQETVFHKIKTENREFQAETKKLLDIVAKSLYTDKEVFLRELLSNSSDALEKVRYLQLKSQGTEQGDPLQISISVDPDKKRIIIQDTGIGMTRDELISNLGTIARSGSKQFVDEINKGQEANSSDNNIIGQFGVGFYSAFIVGNSVEVISISGGKTNMWISDGSGTFEISEIDNPGFERGTKITIHLRPNCLQFSKQDEVKKIVQKYSNFINHPIYLNGERINTVQAIWSLDKKQVTEEQYQNFFEFIANTKINYRYKLHYATDAPLSIKALLYIPSLNNERIGSQQISVEPTEVHLYSRKILIKTNCSELFPNWLRFIKGVVDCEDIPLNISRENYQDSALISKLRSILTKRVIKMLNEESTKNPDLYVSWYKDFQFLIKEGLFTDMENQDLIMQLVRYQCNWKDGYINLDDYIAKLDQAHDKIYYVLANNREAALNSPYMEPFKNTDIPVLFLYSHVDELTFNQVNQYKNKYRFINIETNYEDISKDFKKDQKQEEQTVLHGKLPEEEVTPYCLWMKNELQPVIHKVEVSKRLKDSPALVVGKISSGMRTMMNMIDSSNIGVVDQNLTLEINPNHDLIIQLNQLRKNDMKLANLVARQILDNCLIIAGAVTDPRNYVNRVNQIMLRLLNDAQSESQQVSIDDSTVEAHREKQTNSSILNEIKIENEKLQSQQQDNLNQEFILDENGNPKIINKK